MSEATELKCDDDIGELKRLLQPVAAHWVAIADQLGMASCVRTIRSTSGTTGAPDCLRELLYRWLNREPRATVEALCQALRNDAEIIEGAAVANQLEETFCPGQTGLKRRDNNSSQAKFIDPRVLFSMAQVAQFMNFHVKL